MSPKSNGKPKAAKSKEIELVPDVWPRFEQFVKSAAKAGPQHKVGQQRAKTKKTARKSPKEF